MDTSTSHHYRPPFGKQQQPPPPSLPQQVPPQDTLSFRTARDQLEIDEARTKSNGVVKKSLGMHSSAK